jgi:hypothetical protein
MGEGEKGIHKHVQYPTVLSSNSSKMFFCNRMIWDMKPVCFTNLENGPVTDLCATRRIQNNQFVLSITDITHTRRHAFFGCWRKSQVQSKKIKKFTLKKNVRLLVRLGTAHFFTSPTNVSFKKKFKWVFTIWRYHPSFNRVGPSFSI